MFLYVKKYHSFKKKHTFCSNHLIMNSKPKPYVSKFSQNWHAFFSSNWEWINNKLPNQFFSTVSFSHSLELLMIYGLTNWCVSYDLHSTNPIYERVYGLIKIINIMNIICRYYLYALVDVGISGLFYSILKHYTQWLHMPLTGCICYAFKCTIHIFIIEYWS